MFGNLLGTLQKFKQDETRVKVREQKKKEVEKKIEEKTEKEKEEAKRTKHDLFSEKRKQQQEIKTLKVLLKLRIISQKSQYTLPIEKIITLKNARAWVSMVFT